MDANVWIEQLTRLMDAWPRDQPPTATLDLYEQELAGVSNERFEAVVDRVLRTCVYFPKLADLFRTLEDLKHEERARGQPVTDGRLMLSAGPGQLPPALEAPRSAWQSTGQHTERGHEIVLIRGVPHALHAGGPRPYLAGLAIICAYVRERQRDDPMWLPEVTLPERRDGKDPLIGPSTGRAAPMRPSAAGAQAEGPRTP
ncbi:MAG: hypothetical protein CL878_14760 [Dehalococcoidia bacterium]|nr:hypothetical protein [Dehalococcoidia bacterium]